MNKKLLALLTIIMVCLSYSWVFASQEASDRVPGFPFTEDFTDSTLKDASGTTADWSTDEEALTLNWQEAQSGAFEAGLVGTDISSDAQDTISIVLGDVDGDGDLDMVTGNYGQTNRLYLNNGTANPFNGVMGMDISSDAHFTRSIALGDVDGDGDLDMLAGNNGQTNRLYKNNGTTDPFSEVTGMDIGSEHSNTRSVALGDVDRDGDLDMVAGNYVETNRLYLNNGTADPFDGVTGTDIGSDAQYTFSIALGDMDGDGDLDMVAGNDGQTNRLYRNNGTADPFCDVISTDISSDEDSTTSIALGDVDGDGDLDMLAGNYGQTNRLYMNNGTYHPFNGVIGTDISSDAQYTFSIALGDVDGDGDLDMLAGNYGQTNRLYKNSGTADPFSGISGISISSDEDSTTSIVLGDVDGDSDLDMLAGNDGTNRLYMNNGTADPFNGVTGKDISSDAHGTYSIALGDLDGDGNLDMLAGNYGQTNRLYLNNGTADPFSGVMGIDISDDAHATRSIALGDVDGDGDLDMLAGNYGQTNRLYMNNGTADPFNGVTGTVISNDSDFTQSIALGDVDGDGDLDMVAGNDGTNRLYKNNGTADPFSGVTGTPISSDANSTYAIALGDVDGDGDLDILAGNEDQSNRLYKNNGTANPFNGVTGTVISNDSDFTQSIALGDVDGDGDLDMVAGNDGTNRLYKNNGTADPFSGVTGTPISSDANSTYAIALGDVDGDGDLDILAGNEDQSNRLYKNNGTANPFSDATGSNTSNEKDSTYAIALGDMDEDGDLDIVTGNYDQTNRLYKNNGRVDPFNGVTGSNISNDADYTTSIALGDVDGDGDLDMLVGNYNGQTNRLYKNNGTADPFNSVTGTGITSDAHDTHSIALGDVDGDGDLDMVAGNDGQTNRLYLNNGTADPFNSVSGTDISSDVHSTYAIALGDVDGDGDLDILTGNSGQVNRLYKNNGTADPFSGVMGTDISSDAHLTTSITLGDVDGDGDLDMLGGNWRNTNRLYLNNGTVNPFSGVTGTDISSDAQDTYSIALGDMDGDGDLDMLAGNGNETNRLYLNDGMGDPFDTLGGMDISSDAQWTWSIVLGDVDRDGDLDMLAGNNTQTNRLYKNNGTANPFFGVTGTDISSDEHYTLSIVLGDVDGDGDLDMLAGNSQQTNRLVLNRHTASPFSRVVSSDISSEAHATTVIVLGDLDGDGDLDLVAGNSGQLNHLYKNNGTADPFSGAMGIAISNDTDMTQSIALGDVDGDGDLDMLVGNNGINRLYKNGGSVDPFSGIISGIAISTDAQDTRSIALGDVDGDGDLDIVAGNYGQTNRLYLNNGTAIPFPNTVVGTDIGSDMLNTNSVALGDVDGDGDLDMVTGNYGHTNRLYLNNGTATPFSGVIGTDISSDNFNTYSVALGDMDGDGDLDMVAGDRSHINHLYLNNGTAAPFSTAVGTGISSDADWTHSVALGDVDGDGDLDMVAGNYGLINNRLYINNGTANPFSGLSGISISNDYYGTTSIALGDVDRDGDLDIVTGNDGQPNRLYLQAENYHTGHGLATSLRVDTEVSNIPCATLSATAELPINSSVTYYLSNNGGAMWFIVQPGVSFTFPTSGMDLRWKAELQSLSPILTPRINQIQIEMESNYLNYLPLIIQ